MNDPVGVPDPGRIETVADLARALDALRRRAAGAGQLRLSIRQIGKRAEVPASTLAPYLRGERFCPQDAFIGILGALGVEHDDHHRWVAAWSRLAKAQQQLVTMPVDRPRIVNHGEIFMYAIRSSATTARIGIATGCIRRITRADVWVNSENTHMEMARYFEHSVSAIIRYEGALRDEAGNVIRDDIADELRHNVAGRQVNPGTAVVTGAGQLANSNGVSHVIHVASVHGEPGAGFRQILDIGRCVTNALAEADRLVVGGRKPITVLFPLLGAGVGGAPVEPTVRALAGAAIDYLCARPHGHIGSVLFLAYTEDEAATCRAAFDTNPRLSALANDP